MKWSYILVIICLSLFSCAAHHMPLPAGTLESSSQEGLPIWTTGETKRICPGGSTCFVGVSSKCENKKQALEAARYDAYTQIAESAFPTDISRRYRKFRNSNESQVKEEVQAELLGRLRGAQILDSAWVRRNVYSVRGYSQIFDAWVLASIKKSKLDTLYRDEIERSRKRSEVISAEASVALNRIQGAWTGDDISSLIKRIGACRMELSQLQQTDQRDKASGILETLKHALLKKISLHAASKNHNLDSAGSEIIIDLTADGQALPFTAVELKSDCGGQTRQVTTDHQGRASIEILHPSRIKGCHLTFYSPELEETLETTNIEAPIRCMQTVFSFDIKGFQAGSINAFLYSKAPYLQSVLQPFVKACDQASPDEQEFVLKITLQGNIGNPMRKSGKLIQSGGQAQVSVSVMSNGDILYSTRSDDKALLMMDTEISRITDSLKQKILDLVLEETQTLINRL